eukprot:gene20856-54821_t
MPQVKEQGPCPADAPPLPFETYTSERFTITHLVQWIAG